MPQQTAEIVFGPQVQLPSGVATAVEPGIKVGLVNTPAASELITNLVRTPDGKGLRRRPGYVTVQNFSSNGNKILGMYQSNANYFYALRKGGVLYQLDGGPTDASPQSISGTTLQDNPPSFAEDGTSLLVASGGRINQVNEAARTTNLVSAGNAPDSVTHVGFAKQNLISNGLISGGIAGDVNFSTDIGNNYEAADSWRLFNNEEKADACTALVIDHDEIIAFGPKSTEVSFDDGITPWAALTGAYVPYGTLAPYGPIIQNQTIYFVAQVDDRFALVKLQNRQPLVLSTPWDELLNYGGYTPVMFSVNCEGEPYIFLQDVGISDGTLVYSPKWDEWYKWSGTASSKFPMYSAKNYVYGGRNYAMFGDSTDAKLYAASHGTQTDDGTAIACEILGPVSDFGTINEKRPCEYQFVFFRGDVSNGSEPTVTLDFNDNGEGFSGSPETLSLGISTNKYYVYRLFGPLGIFRTRQLKLSFSGAVSSFILAKASMTYEVLDN